MKSTFNLLVFGVIILRTCYVSPSIIIVGAGPAGIAAATRLLENNITDITILEAEGRLGGRVYSIEFGGDTMVDLGAEWCHGEEGNIVYENMKDLNILQHTYLGNLKFYYSTREEIDSELNDNIFEMIHAIYFADGHKKQTEGINLGDYCMEQYNSSITELHLNNSKSLNFANDALSYFQKYVISSEGSFSWFHPSAESDFSECAGDLALNWAGYGYKLYLDIMMKKFPDGNTPLPIDDKIVLNKEVSEITWDDNDANPYGVTVKCTDGSSYNANQVIFTPSLGVLKEQHNTLFKPQLPDYKKMAINKLGIGAVMKVMLHFSKVWWPQEEFSGFNLVWSTEDRQSILNETSTAWTFDILGLFPPANKSNVLSAWFVGPHVPEIEQLDEETLMTGIKFILKKFLGHIYNVTSPDAFIRSKWYTNPHFRGSYSYQTVASRQRKSNVDLARPLNNNRGGPTLLFAGEATNDVHYSTVHGAIETGYREAERIINLSNVLHK